MSNDTGILAGRTVLVTGSSGGLGSEIALRLSLEGAAIALHYHRTKPVEIVELIQENNGKFCTVQADMAKKGFEVELLDLVEEHLSKPDILVNCAACQDIETMEDMSTSAFDKMMNTNVSAVFALSREFARRLPSQLASHASIINISSIEAARPAPGHGHYATSKAALEMLTKSMAQEYGAKGLRVNAIAPGLIARDNIEHEWPQGVNRWVGTCPLGRMGTPDDVAQAVLFLVSNSAGFISGSVLTIDGGMSAMPGW